MTEQEIIKTIHISTGIDIPERMNNPLDYEPHPLCIAACKELQAYLAERKDWREEIDKGKMFGVLIVEKNDKEIGYLAAYSGQMEGEATGRDSCLPSSTTYNPMAISKPTRQR